MGAQPGAVGSMIAYQAVDMTPEARAVVGLQEMRALVSDHIVRHRERGHGETPGEADRARLRAARRRTGAPTAARIRETQSWRRDAESRAMMNGARHEDRQGLPPDRSRHQLRINLAQATARETSSIRTRRHNLRPPAIGMQKERLAQQAHRVAGLQRHGGWPSRQSLDDPIAPRLGEGGGVRKVLEGGRGDDRISTQDVDPNGNSPRPPVDPQADVEAA